MEVISVDFNGNYQVDWIYFNDVVRVVGIFIVLISFIVLVASVIGGSSDISFFCGFVCFGFIIFAEATIASFFKVK